MRLYNKVNPLSSGALAGKKNKGVLFINPNASDTILEVVIKNSDGSTLSTEMFVNGTSDMTSFVGPVNYFIYPFSIQSWTATSGSANAYELY